MNKKEKYINKIKYCETTLKNLNFLSEKQKDYILEKNIDHILSGAKNRRRLLLCASLNLLNWRKKIRKAGIYDTFKRLLKRDGCIGKRTSQQ